jgi:hypothetical protein
VTCQHAGVCNNGACECPVGVEGGNCQTLSRNKFLATYNGDDLCSDTAFRQYSIHLVATIDDSITMTITNFLDSANDSAVCTIQSTDSFSFMGNNYGITYTGWGTLSNDSLKLTYTIYYDTVHYYTCTYMGQSLRL